jgi:hypothetical protein
MMAMSRALGLRPSGRTGRKAWGAIRFFAALWMVFYIAYTPIHLYLEPHSDGGNASSGTAFAHSGDCVADDRHDDGDHHERHSAEQHKFKVTQPTRAIVAELVPVQLMEWVNPDRGCPQPQVVEFSGLSPPEFHCCWQFIFRAALPIRAPSLLS